MEISNKDLSKILMYANFSDELDYKVYAKLDDGVIYLDATLTDNFSLMCFLYIDDQEVYLTKDQVDLLMNKMQEFTSDLIDYDDNDEVLTWKEWRELLDCLNKIY